MAERGGFPGLRVNERIRDRELRVIDDEGNHLGVMTLFDAMKKAREMGLDIGRAKMDLLLKKLTDYVNVEFGPRMEANILPAPVYPKGGLRATIGNPPESAFSGASDVHRRVYQIES